MRVAKRAGRKNIKPRPPHPIFTVRFTEGLATRNRLPLDHVIRVLQEIKAMLETVGRQVQRQRGAENPTGDFGIEIVAGFQKGSVKTTLAITRDVDAGVLAATQVLDTVSRLGDRQWRRKPVQAIAGGIVPEFDPRLVTRLGNISKVQEIDKTKLELALRTNGGRPQKAVFDRRTSQVISALREPNFAIEGITVYGRLRELHDRADDDESKKTFFGELIGDDGIVWRIEFKPRDVDRAAALFRRQVYVTGNVTYFKAINPRILAVNFGPDEDRDYETAFDELYGSDKGLAGVELKTLINGLDD